MCVRYSKFEFVFFFNVLVPTTSTTSLTFLNLRDWGYKQGLETH